MEETTILDPRRREPPDWSTESAGHIRRGGVVAIPTETFYGLAADPRDAASVGRVRQLKGHPAGRSILLLAASPDQAAMVADLGARCCAALAAAFWPGPLTLIVRVAGADLPACPSGTVAVRVPGHPLARRLAEAAGVPVTGTSANPAGRPPASTAAQVGRYFPAGLAAIVDGGPTAGGEPSTLLDLTGAAPSLLRAGPVARADLEAVLGVVLPPAPVTPR